MMKFVKIFLFSGALLMMLSPIYFVNAGLVPCGGTATDSKEACTICDLATGIQKIVNFVTKLVGITLVVIIVVAGVMYIVSAGNPSMTTMAKTAMKNSVIGAIVVLTAFVLINFILVAISKGGPSTGDLSGMGSKNWTLNITCQSSGQ